MTLRGITKDWTPDKSTEGTIFVGNKRGTWPLVFFANEGHATTWMAEDPGHRVWVVDTKVLYEMEYIPPGQAQLRPKGGGA